MISWGWNGEGEVVKTKVLGEMWDSLASDLPARRRNMASRASGLSRWLRSPGPKPTGPTKGGPPTMGGTTVAAAAARASRVCWTCWYVLVAIIGRITGAAGTCIASTVGTVGTAGTAVGIPVTGAPRTSCSNRAISASISFKRSSPLFPGMPAPGPGTTGPPAPGRPGAGPAPAIAAAVTVSGTTALALWPPPVPLYTLWLRQGGRPRMTYKRKRRAPIHDVMRQQGWPLEWEPMRTWPHPESPPPRRTIGQSECRRKESTEETAFRGVQPRETATPSWGNTARP